jgi:DUF1365 family protein
VSSPAAAAARPVPDLSSAAGPPAWIYRGTLRHRRFAPVPHAFTYSLFELLLDVDRLDEVFSGTWLWSRERFNVASFRRSDYLGDPARSLGDAVRDEVEALGGARPRGRIWMLSHLRYLGYCFNPVTFYYCVGPDGELEAVLGEITNTPWLERHRYLVQAGDGASDLGTREGNALRRVFDKAFHVSPFFGMRQSYDWRFTKPGATLAVHMENRELAGEVAVPAGAVAVGREAAGLPGAGSGGRAAESGDAPTDGAERLVFDATLTMRAVPWTRAQRAWTLLRFPAMTARVWLGIHWQAFRLWQKRVPVHPHPRNGANGGGNVRSERRAS